MKISVFGLGYVGCTSAACLSELGHNVIGVDINPDKTSLINQGKGTFVEEGIDELVDSGKVSRRLSATTDPSQAVMNSDLCFVCVPTPSNPYGEPDLSYVETIATELGTLLSTKNSFFTIVLRSTVPPGTTRAFESRVKDSSGKVPGLDFAVVHNPEFLREGSSISDFMNPELIVIASDSLRGRAELKALYEELPGNLIETSLEVSEMLKYVNNSFHALKVSFANELYRICFQQGVDAAELMRVFCKDSKLNISEAYLKPGFAYGGSCLPKDLSGLVSMADRNRVKVPIIKSISESNKLHIASLFQRIMDTGLRRITVVGLSFKQNTDDLRNSPAVDLIELLLGKGMQIRVFDPGVVYSRITGRNKEFIDSRLPHIASLLASDAESAFIGAELIVLLHRIEIPERFRSEVQVISAFPDE